jgi:hypothetical protein
MELRLRPALAGSIAAVTITVFATTAVASAAPAPGGIPARFIRNQFQYCAVICPFVVQGVATVPIAVAATPVTFAGALLSSASLAQAVGTAASSVTAPTLAATDPIITNDLTLVLPKAQNALQVAAVEFINVGLATRDPGELVKAIGDARTNIAAALDQRLGDPVGPTGAVNLPQVVAVEAINVVSAVAFQATEQGLLDIVRTADDTAQTLARTGNVAAAASVGARDAANAVGAAQRTITDSVNNAATHIRSSLRDPFPPAVGRSAQKPTTNSHPPTGRRLVDRIVHHVMRAHHTRKNRG